MTYMDPRPEGLNTEKAPESIVETLRTPDLNTVTFDASQYQLVPKVPSSEMLDSAVSFALNVKISGSYNWSAYMGDLWRQMLDAAPTPAAQSAGQEPIYQARTGVSEWADLSRLQFERIKLDKRIVYTAPVNASVPVGETALRSRWNRIANSEDMFEQFVAEVRALIAAPVNGGEREALRALVEMIDAGRAQGGEKS